MKIKRVGKGIPDAICNLGIGQTFICDGRIHLVVYHHKNSGRTEKENYTQAVNLQDNILVEIRNDVDVYPVDAEIVCN